jgi:uncharacterized protein YqhQ
MKSLNARSTLSVADFILFGLILASLVFTMAYWVTGWHAAFSRGFAMEDGPVEWGTAVGLFVAALVLLRNSAALWRRQGAAAAIITFVYALLFIFGAGEEISWGQRVFGWETTDFFAEHNYQRETNLHNLMVGEHRLARTLFGNALTVVLLLYLVVLPVLQPRSRLVARLVDRVVLPVPGGRHAAWALAGSLVVAAVVMDRKWEVYELVFALLAVSIFLNPRNAAAAPTQR